MGDKDCAELGGDADSTGASSRQQISFDSIDKMETWLVASGWTCLLLVGNNSAGYTEEAYQVY